ncbi:MAG TPA: M10 family metallopeptidase, partial [Dongiaceae bacterium]
MATQDNAFPGAGHGNIYVDSLIWGARWVNGPIFYYFGDGPIPGESGTGYAWFESEKTAFRQVLQLYENVCNLDFQEVGTYGESDIAWWLVPSGYVGGSLGQHEIPDGTFHPIHGEFNALDSSWTLAGLQQGGYAFLTVLHEIGHGLGLAHPHDGGSEFDATIFPGVTGPFNTGAFGLNQGIWTNMSYNDGWNVVPSSGSAFGWQGTPMAFDIAALQVMYGANTTYNTGDNTYFLPGANAPGTFWSCIWDAGGTDAISAEFLSGNCFINLADAPLEGPNAGGFVSWMAGIRGGFTIAHDVDVAGVIINVIENAIGGKGNDIIVGNEFANNLSGGLGKDTLDGAAGADLLNGGGGNDVYIVDEIGDVVTESDPSAAGGIDLVKSNLGIELGKNVEQLMLTGSGDTDGKGNELANILVGNPGSNVLNGGGGADRMIGGAGDDTYVVDSKADVVTETLAKSAGGTDTIESEISLALGVNIENLVLTGAGNLVGVGNVLDNGIFGTDGNDTLAGLTGKDQLIGNGGADKLDGGVGEDTMEGGEGDDIYMQDNALDFLFEAGSSAGDELRTNQLLANAIGGIEHYTFLAAKAVSFTGDDQANRITGTALADKLDGAGGDDSLIGAAGNDSLVGALGADSLNGGAGNDNMNGGDGDDIYVVDSKADAVVDSGGTDKVESAIGYMLGAGIENLALIGMATIGIGNDLDNQILGNVLANKLDGAGGADILMGGDGNDTYFLDDDGDDVVESGGVKGGIDHIISKVNYTLGDFEENLTLDAAGAATLATGNTLNNVLIGNGLDNTLDGNEGIDKMAGGAGNDTYRFDNAKDVAIEGKAAGTDTVEGGVTVVLGAYLEHLTLLDAEDINGTGNGFDNAITGNSGNNKLSGLVGADTLTGGLGGDTLDGGVGDDSMIGGGGDDVFVVNSLADKLEDSSGSDTVQSFITFALGGDFENLSLLGTGVINGTGNAGGNRLTGNGVANKLDGLEGADTIDGG